MEGSGRISPPVVLSIYDNSRIHVLHGAALVVDDDAVAYHWFGPACAVQSRITLVVPDRATVDGGRAGQAVDAAARYPGLIGVDYVERGQAVAIAENLFRMCMLKTPILVFVIGEGGSGGALGIGIGDRLYVLEYAYYSVISPEGCAAILWKERSKAPEAAEALKLTGKDLYDLGVVDDIVKEPLGGAHRDPQEMAQSIKSVIKADLDALKKIDRDELIGRRYEKLRKIGVFSANSGDTSLK